MQQPGNRPGAFRLRVAISAMTLAIWAVATIPAAADDAVETRQLVEISAAQCLRTASPSARSLGHGLDEP